MDAQSFWSRLNFKGDKESKVQQVSTKAPKETITHAIAADLSLSVDQPLSGILEELLATPEAVRRISKPLSSRVPSLDSIALPFESEAALGFDDGVPLMMPWEETSADALKHSFGRTTDKVDLGLPVPEDVQTVPPTIKKPRFRRKTSKAKLIDEETQLGREHQFFTSGEGLADAVDYSTLLLTVYLPVNNNDQKICKKRQIEPSSMEIGRQGQFLESGPYEWDFAEDMRFLPEGQAGGQIGSSSIGGAFAMGFSPMNPSSRSLAGLTSSPIAQQNWRLSSIVASRRESYEFLAYFCHFENFPLL